MKQIRVSLIILLMLGLGIASGWLWTNFGNNIVTFASTTTPIISVKNQKNVPLLISAPYIDSNVLKPTYGYSLTNLSDKPIRAFTIQSDVFYGSANNKQSGAIFAHLPLKKQMIQPKDSRQESEGGNSTYPEAVNEIILSVDFVEFDDGTTWGTDYYTSAERLAGLREGAKFAIERFRNKLETEGFQDFSNEIEEYAIDFVLQADESKSSVWRSGFENGVGTIRNRLKRAISDAGLKGATQELRKSFEETEGGQKK